MGVRETEQALPGGCSHTIPHHVAIRSVLPQPYDFLTDKHYSRPGILVLINDADWELEGETSYALQAHDNILFVSTLHGG